MKFFHAFCCVLLVSCLEPSGDYDDDSSGDAPVDGAVGELSDTSLATVKTFTQTASNYNTWTGYSTVQDQTLNSPHGKVTMFFNKTLEDSMRAGNTQHSKGSIVIKPLYESDATTIKGYALMAKVDDTSGANSWLFYEGFPPNYDEFFELGHSGCTGCHASGTDYIRASLP